MFSLPDNRFTTTVRALLLAAIVLPASVYAAGKYGLGKPATKAEIAGWDIDIRPDGMGLPAGSGSVEDGEPLYENKCAACHGSFGEGVGRWPKLAGGEDTLTENRPEKTIGSYWPYASTLWDYINRAMPFTAPQSLETDEVYAITAYVLYLNDLVDDDFVLTKENFTEIEMPNAGNFYLDDRPDVQNKRCMKDCLDPAKIIVTHTVNSGITSTSVEDDAEEEAAPATAAEHPGAGVYKQACQVCHDSGLANAPKLGDAEAWNERLNKGLETLYLHANKGFNAMPAKGGNTTLSDEAVNQAVDYILSKSR